MRDFSQAVRQEIDPSDDGDSVTFMHGDQEVTFYKPGAAQMAIMAGMFQRGGNLSAGEIGTFINLFFSMADEESQRYFETRLLDRRDPFELDSEFGVFDIFQDLMEEWGDRPTKQPSDYQKSRSATGTSSTGTTRGKGSTSSRSRSRASSR